jgi:hypothetical protein
MANKSKSGIVQRHRLNEPVNHETDLTRQIDVRRQRETLLVVTNGERTECDYFEGLRKEPWVTVTLRTKFHRGEPDDAVVLAVQISQSDEYDNIWVVCDVDEYDVSLAIQHSREGGIGLALSVPSFEVWLILHLSPKCPSFNDATQAGQHLAKMLPKWDKRNLRFSDFRDGVTLAIKGAKIRDAPPEGNPSTDVWRLVELLG